MRSYKILITALLFFFAFTAGVSTYAQSYPGDTIVPRVKIVNVQNQAQQDAVVIGSAILFGVMVLFVMILFISVFKKTKRFSRDEAIVYGWSLMKQKTRFFIMLLLLQFLVVNFLTALTSMVEFYNPDLYTKFIVVIQGAQLNVIGVTVSCLAFLLSQWTSLGMLRIGLKTAKKESTGFKDLFPSPFLFLRYIIGLFFFTLIIAAGGILFIIPGIILGSIFSLWSYFLVDKNLGPFSALRQSFIHTRGARLDLVLFWFLLAVINFTGTILLYVGTFVTAPVTLLAGVYIYISLSDKKPQLTS